MPSKALALSCIDDMVEILDGDDVEVVNVQRSSTSDGETLVIQVVRYDEEEGTLDPKGSTPPGDGSCPRCSSPRSMQKLFEPKTGEMKCAHCGHTY